MEESEELEDFKEAMQLIYGRFDLLDVEQAASWTLPENLGGHRGRYLWTDAFGVLNFLTLHKETGDQKYLVLAGSLIKTVHSVLGYDRGGKVRLPGASDQNPLGGGLRIGKVDKKGPDGDGQYHHYLAIWMYALNRMSIASGDRSYNDQAIALAKAIHPRFFANVKSDTPQMYWKIAMDMSRPLVASEGNLDAVDGYVVFSLLAATAGDPNCLAKEIADYQRVIDRKGKHTISNDMLDLGMSLWIAHWGSPDHTSAQQMGTRCLERFGEKPPAPSSDPLDLGLLRTTDKLDHQEVFGEYPHTRVAFRDLGASLGLRCYAGDKPEYDKLARKLYANWDAFLQYQPEELQPISQVMFAAALIPGGK
ncbi:MAG: hypothetical protein LQ352_003693 [Teloschistes flavicans]|nr:MAG: hypothetical protein LQ352_003693 [Teloschistes flavicans]